MSRERRRNLTQLCADINRGRDALIAVLDRLSGHLEQQQQAVIDGIRCADAALAWLHSEAKRERPSLLAGAAADDFDGVTSGYIAFLRKTITWYWRWEREYVSCFERWGDSFYAEQADDARTQAEYWEEKLRERQG